jgi:thymidine kinase
MKTISIHALFAADSIKPNESLNVHPRELMASADVILGVDVISQDEALFFGRRTLEQVAAGTESREVSVLKVELDMDTDEVERLAALVQVVKGHHDYQAS